jgi:hypothetical protein
MGCCRQRVRRAHQPKVTPWSIRTKKSRHSGQLEQLRAPQQLPLGPQAISVQAISMSCSESLCGMRVTRRVWFRF